MTGPHSMNRPTMTKRTRTPFTGRKMAAILVAGFGIVVAVNFTMASFATSGFHGVVVENSYVASQEFNGWLDEAERARALGWEAEIKRDEAGHVLVTTSNVPDAAAMTAKLRRPLGKREYASLDFERQDGGLYRSTRAVDQGRWTIRLFIRSGETNWADESELP